MLVTKMKHQDVSEIAKDAIRLVQSVEGDKGVTMLYAIDVFRGSKNAKVSISNSSVALEIVFICYELLDRREWS